MKKKLKDETVEEFLKRGGQVKVLRPWTQEHQEQTAAVDVSKFSSLGQMAEAMQRARKRAGKVLR